jgi:hypothetical protein
VWASPDSGRIDVVPAAAEHGETVRAASARGAAASMPRANPLTIVTPRCRRPPVIRHLTPYAAAARAEMATASASPGTSAAHANGAATDDADGYCASVGTDV